MTEGKRGPTTTWTGRRARIGALGLSGLPRLLFLKLTGDVRPVVFEHLALAPDMTIVDVGCGPGFFALRLGRLVPRGEVVGVDLSREMLAVLERAARRAGLGGVIRAAHGPAETLPLADASADRVFTSAALHEVSDPARAAAEFSRVLRPGGIAVAVDFAASSLVNRIFHHRHGGSSHSWEEGDLARLLTGAGFTGVGETRVGVFRIAWGTKA
jgi:ubiquinone/menaquinone biosynthesis C-methylase UbiE